MPKPPSYGIIYNWDGAPHGYSEYPQSTETFLEKVYAPINKTQVGAHFWCVGAHHARWESQVLEMIGEGNNRKYENARSYISNENVRAMLERGEDPQEAAINRGRELGMHVYASVRMNDNHFGRRPEDMPKMHSTSLSRMRKEHPEWLLGDRTADWFGLSWDFSVPEVREHRYKHIEELCTLYDWDGVEMDWQRHAFHLPEDYGYRLKYVLTDLQRAVRRMTNKLGKNRGRPYYLAARVSGSLEMCRKIGYDIPTWVEENLVDILIPAGLSDTDPSIDAKEYVDLCKGTEIAVYPGLDTGERYPRSQFERNDSVWLMEDAFGKDQRLNRAIATRYHRDGADGIYIFNWHSDKNTRRELLSQLGSPETLKRKNKTYAATHRYLVKVGAEHTWHGAFDGDRILGEVPVPLKQTLTGDGPTATLDIADDLSVDVPSEIELRVRLDEWVKGDIVHVFWDGIKVEHFEVQYDLENNNYANPFGAPIADVTSAVWLTTNLDVATVLKGPHRVKVVLVKRNERVSSDVILTDVELTINYDSI